MKINIPKTMIFLTVFAISVFISVKLELPWFVGIFFIVGTTEVATKFYDAAVQSWKEVA